MTGAARLSTDRRTMVERAYRENRVSLKAIDALAVDRATCALPHERGPRPNWTFVESDPWRYFLASQTGRVK